MMITLSLARIVPFASLSIISLCFRNGVLTVLHMDGLPLQPFFPITWS